MIKKALNIIDNIEKICNTEIIGGMEEYFYKISESKRRLSGKTY